MTKFRRIAHLESETIESLEIVGIIGEKQKKLSSF